VRSAWVAIVFCVAAAGMGGGWPAAAEEPAAQDSRAAVSPQPPAAQPPVAQTQDAQHPTPPVSPPPVTVPSATADACEVPAYLAPDNGLPKVAEAIKAKQRLDILVVGSASSALAGADGTSASYPARLEAALREKLSGVAVTVTANLQLKKTAAEVAEGLGKLASDRKPTLVVWQTGTVDALKSVDPDDFRAAVDDGVSTLVNAGADVLLMNLQYTPRMETMISVAPYLDSMRVSAQEHNIPLFDRFAMMRDWNESGRFDLFTPSHGLGLARRVHDCLGRALAKFVIDAAHIDAAEPRIQR
jgi:hypothetical protein